MSDGRLNADVQGYRQAAGLSPPPPPIGSDQTVTGGSPVEQLLRVLGLAANAGDPTDHSEGVEEHARRRALMAAAADTFALSEDEAAAELGAVATDDPARAATSSLPQAASAIAGAVSGALGGLLQPLSQIPQQAAQGAQQALQTGLGLLGQANVDLSTPVDEQNSLESVPLTDEFGLQANDLADLGEFAAGPAGTPDAGGFGGGGGDTTPSAVLGPPPVPTVGTAPSSAPARAPAAPGPVAAAPPAGGGLTGVPMVPPGAMGAAGGGDKESKPDTKRVSAPAVRNGAPVQGRLTPPATMPPVTKTIEGRPVATRRLVTPPGTAAGAPSDA